MLFPPRTIYNNEWWLGKCLVSPNEPLCFAVIPKCATGSVGTWLTRCGGDLWHDDNFITSQQLSEHKKIIVLREPIIRFKGAVGEIMYHRAEHGANLHMLFNFLAEEPFFKPGYINLHFYSQAHYCNGLSEDECIFVRLEDVDKALPILCNRPGPLQHMRTSADEKKKEIMCLVNKWFTEEKQETVRQRYQDDIKLLDYLEKEDLFFK